MGSMQESVALSHSTAPDLQDAYSRSIEVTKDKYYDNLFWTTDNGIDRPVLLLPKRFLYDDVTTAALDKQLADIQRQSALLASHRNYHTPIWRLPNETLSIIFLAYAFITDTLTSLEWTKTIMRVCQRWRSVARRTPALWSYVAPRPQLRRLQLDPRIVEAQLRLSAAHPLTVVLNETGTPRYRQRLAIQTLEPHLERIQSLELEIHMERADVFLRSLGWRKRDTLRHLRLLSQSGAYLLPDDVAENVVGGLRSIELVNVSLKWVLLRNLVSIELSSESVELGVSLDTATLLDVLRASPTLENLSLVRCLREDDDARNVGMRVPIELPRLRAVQIQGTKATCLTIFDTVHLPFDVAISLDIIDLSKGTDLRPLLVRLRKHFRCRRPPPPILRSIRFVDSRDAAYMQVAFFVDNLIFTHSGTIKNQGSEGALLRLVLHAQDGRELRRMMTKILDAIPVENVETLDLKCVVYPGTCRAVFSHLPALKTLRFDTIMNAHTCLRVLHILVESSSQAGSGSPLLRSPPRLLKYIRWEASLGHGTQWSNEIEEKIAGELVLVLDAYTRLGKAVERVYIEGNSCLSNQTLTTIAAKVDLALNGVHRKTVS
ncbi:hypothetical protein BD626DRAFT_624282 [Schizophyllum amplum]|uniref:Uncharacterized protein n=1 Tax=Schizophyllum amplum TaxID=97359 RepID=A0A550CVK9_9AGAR|nr:hypothetical protein BD626DRAFT_624282 [Auriculariopsis ampla]